MANQYAILKKKHQEEVNNFPMMFAFSNEQFAEGMKELGLTEDDTDQIYSIGGGGYIRKSDSGAFNEMVYRHEREMQDAINSDLTGEGFIFDMFDYELANHEYGYTGDVEPTLDALGLTVDDINRDIRMINALNKAARNQEG